MNDTIQTAFLAGNIAILTENVDGKLYLIKAKSFRDILDDWNGECRSVPENDASVFFASYNGEPVNPYCYTDFESLLEYMASSLGITPQGTPIATTAAAIEEGKRIVTNPNAKGYQSPSGLKDVIDAI